MSVSLPPTTLGFVDPPVRVLRVAVDRVRLLSDARIAADVWARVAPLEDLALNTPRGALHPKRRGIVTPGAVRAAWNGDGVFVLARQAESVNEERHEYHVEIEAQGMCCSSSKMGMEAAEGVRIAVEDALYPDVDMSSHWYPGQWDVCVDLELTGNVTHASRWIEWAVFASGNKDTALARFVTRTSERKHALAGMQVIGPDVEERHAVFGRIIGKEAPGRSLYAGSTVRFLVYEKDKDPGRDLPLVKDRWREAGWDGESRVIRVEARVQRQWMHANILATDAGTELPLNEFRWREFAPYVPTLASALFARFRHTDPHDDTTRKDRRASSVLWVAIQGALETWAKEYLGELWSGAERVKAVQRESSHLRTLQAWEMATIKLAQHARRGTELHTIVHSLADTLLHEESQHSREHLENVAVRYAREMGLAAPDPDLLSPRRLRDRGAKALEQAVPPVCEDEPPEEWR